MSNETHTIHISLYCIIMCSICLSLSAQRWHGSDRNTQTGFSDDGRQRLCFWYQRYGDSTWVLRLVRGSRQGKVLSLISTMSISKFSVRLLFCMSVGSVRFAWVMISCCHLYTVLVWWSEIIKAYMFPLLWLIHWNCNLCCFRLYLISV